MMSRVGTCVLLAHRTKRINNYISLYLCKKTFSCVCYVINTTEDFVSIKNQHANTTYDSYEITMRVGIAWVIVKDQKIYIMKLGFESPIRIRFTERLRDLYYKLDFNELYWCALETIAPRNSCFWD